MTLEAIVKAKGGILYANGIRALIPAVGHSPADRSVSLLIGHTGRIIVHSFGAATVHDVLADLTDSGLINETGSPTNTHTGSRPAPQLSTSAKQRRADALWSEGRPIADSVSARYITDSRAVRRPVQSLVGLRHHPYCPLSAYKPFCRATRPALLSRLQTADNRTAGVEITYLTASGKRDESLFASRKLIGSVPPGAFVALDAPAAHMVVGEGVMTVLSATEYLGLPGRALLSAHNLSRFEPDPTMRRLTIAADRGTVGETAAQALRFRLLHRLDFVEIVLPPEPYDDFNAWAQAMRKEEGRAQWGDV